MFKRTNIIALALAGLFAAAALAPAMASTARQVTVRGEINKQPSPGPSCKPDCMLRQLGGGVHRAFLNPQPLPPNR
jgi:hypothetical protein